MNNQIIKEAISYHADTINKLLTFYQKENCSVEFLERKLGKLCHEKKKNDLMYEDNAGSIENIAASLAKKYIPNALMYEIYIIESFLYHSRYDNLYSDPLDLRNNVDAIYCLPTVWDRVRVDIPMYIKQQDEKLKDAINEMKQMINNTI